MRQGIVFGVLLLIILILAGSVVVFVNDKQALKETIERKNEELEALTLENEELSAVTGFQVTG